MKSSFVLLVSFLSAFQVSSQSTIASLLNAPFASDLVVNSSGDKMAWVENVGGERNIYIASGSEFTDVIQLTNYNGDQGITISNLTFTPDGNNLLFIRGNTKNRRGEPANPAHLQESTAQTLYLANLKTREIQKIGEGTGPAISSDGTKVAYGNKGQVWMASLIDTSQSPMELFTARGGKGSLSWSPDDSHISFVSSRGDHSMIGIFNIGENRITYPDPSVDIDRYPAWSPDGKSIAYIRMPNRRHVPPFTPQQEGHPWSIKILNVESGESNAFWTAKEGRGSVFFSNYPSLKLSWADNNTLIFPWEGDGWQHLYKLNITSGNETLLTPGDGIVEDYILSRDKKSIYFTSNIEDIHRRHIWKTDIMFGDMEMMSSGTSVEYSPVETKNGIAALFTSANHTSRPGLIKDGKPAEIGNMGMEFGSFEIPEVVQIEAADGFTSYATIFYPENYDPAKKYPVAMFLHGGSRRQMLQGFHYSSYYSNAFALQQHFANQGYLALSLNYRSGIGYGLNFREADEYGITGASEVRDLIAAGEFLARRNDVDPSKIALWGGSYGGYLTAHGIAQRGDLFSVGVDIHGVHNWNTELPTFATWYDPIKFPEVAELAFQSSPEAHIEGWKNPVLFIHGDDDRNVPFSESVYITEMLRDRDIYFEQLVFPDEVHGFLMTKNWIDAYEATYEFINRYIRR